MTRVRIEYAKGALMGLCAVAGLALCILGRSADAAWMVPFFGGLTAYFVLKARAFATAATRGCGRRPR